MASSKRILVVDDDPLVLRSVARALRRAGYDVMTAADVSTAVSLASQGPVNVALVDYALSRETGLTFLSRLRELQPNCLRVLMTGHSESSIVVEAINRGEVVRVVRKPFEQSDLIHLLDEAFESVARSDKARTEHLIAGAMKERAGLDEVVRGDRFALVVQPIVAVNGDAVPRCIAYEALLRPDHPDFDGPISLLQVAERYSRIGDLGAAVLRLAAAWAERIVPTQRLFVNLHPAQLGDPEALQRSLRPLQDYASRVTLEITERSRLQDFRRWEESVRVITDAGFQLAVDDLGAGYSSLTMLADLSPAFIKLDMSLVRNCDSIPSKQRLAHVIQIFGDATGAQVIAEGVETEAEADALRGCGITLMQGFYFGRPSAALS